MPLLGSLQPTEEDSGADVGQVDFFATSSTDVRAIMVAIGIFAASWLEIGQLVTVGAFMLGFLGLRFWRERQSRSSSCAGACGSVSRQPGLAAAFAQQRRRPLPSIIGSPQSLADSGRPIVRQDSKVPVQAPTFQSKGLAAQVDELLAQIAPTPESERVARELARCAKLSISRILSDAEVSVVTSGDVVRGTAFGVAVPELELVAMVSSASLIQQLQGRLTKGGLSAARLDARKLQKSAIRACTDQLVTHGGFKFRRSAFRCQEPKVTLMAPPTLGVSCMGIPIDFTVNSATPLYHSALLAECAKIDRRAQSLVLVVRRWAKDRGVCHVVKGHLPPYAWTLMTIYYLQVGVGEHPLLPPLQGFRMAKGLVVCCGGDGEASRGQAWQPVPAHSFVAKASVGELFRGFISFYEQGLDWTREAVSIRCGQRAAANALLVPHMVADEDGSMEVGPTIEDPFEPARNLGSSTTIQGLRRLKEELARAKALLARGDEANLSELLEPWCPPERAD